MSPHSAEVLPTGGGREPALCGGTPGTGHPTDDVTLVENLLSPLALAPVRLRSLRLAVCLPRCSAGPPPPEMGHCLPQEATLTGPALI